MITSGNASKNKLKLGRPITSGEVRLNNETTSGTLNPHSISNVTSFNMKAINPAITKPGNKPKELIFFKKLYFVVKFLIGSDNVVIIHNAIATVIEIGCNRYLSTSDTKT